MTQSIGFSGIKTGGDEQVPVEFDLTAYSGGDIDHPRRRSGQVTLSITGPMGDGTFFDTVVDLELPLARTIAAALVALADWADRTDREERADAAE